MQISRSCLIYIPEDIYSVEEEDESSVTILSYKGGSFYGMNQVGLDFWRLAQEETNLTNILAILKSEYDVSEKQLWNDIKDLVEALTDAGLLVVVES